SFTTPSAPPFVPSHTASTVQTTVASRPAVAATFAATNGRMARSGFSFPLVQLKISDWLIWNAPLEFCVFRPGLARRTGPGNRAAAPMTGGLLWTTDRG